MTHITPDDTTERTSESAVDPTTRHRLLADERRRAACIALADLDTDVHLTVLADAVATSESTTHSADATERVGVTLHHLHLPLLDDAGVVDYEATTHHVTPHCGVLDELLN